MYQNTSNEIKEAYMPVLERTETNYFSTANKYYHLFLSQLSLKVLVVTLKKFW